MGKKQMQGSLLAKGAVCLLKATDQRIPGAKKGEDLQAGFLQLG